MKFKMNKQQKILSCYGHVDAKSIAIMVGCALPYVYHVLENNNLKPQEKYKVRHSPTSRRGVQLKRDSILKIFKYHGFDEVNCPYFSYEDIVKIAKQIANDR